MTQDHQARKTSDVRMIETTDAAGDDAYVSTERLTLTLLECVRG